MYIYVCTYIYIYIYIYTQVSGDLELVNMQDIKKRWR